jgi:threonine synthase
MRYRSTSGKAPLTSLRGAVLRGLAPDGGLYMPVEIARHSPEELEEFRRLPFTEVCYRVVRPFAGAEVPDEMLWQIVSEAINFPVKLVSLSPGLHILELFHGPTLAFKDFGARFMARLMAYFVREETRPLTVLVATSGDTGSAVAHGFLGVPGIRVVILYPSKRISEAQEKQFTTLGENITALEVAGTFDDCQRLVKQAFLDPELRRQTELSSANSINLGRLLPQAVYYAATSLAVWRRYGEPASFVVPSGNLGNVAACIWARKVGLPIGEIVLAHNANRTVPDYLDSGIWQPRPSIATLASAMDVGNPSNMERLRALFPDVGDMRAAVSAHTVSDDAIRARIRMGFEEFGQVWCPHTATGADAFERLCLARNGAPKRQGRWVVVGTAHPAKFREIVEPLIGRTIPGPETLTKLFARPTQCSEIEADLPALRAALGPGSPSWKT